MDNKLIRIMRYWRLVIVLLIVTVVSLMVHMKYDDEIIKNISLAVFSSGVVLIMYELISMTYGDYKEKIFDHLGDAVPLYKESKKYGLDKISNSFYFQNEEDSSDFIDSKFITIVMNDGKRFIDNNSQMFQERFNKKGKETSFILLNPSSDFVKILNKNNGRKDGYYQEKILSVIEDLLKYEHHNKHEINIYLNNSFNTMSVVLLDTSVNISLYRFTRGKTDVPHIKFENNKYMKNEYGYISKDLEQLKELSVQIKDNKDLELIRNKCK